MFKRVFSFILIMVMSICTITAEAKDVYFANYRFVLNEYGEILSKSFDEAYCPTQIEIDPDAQAINIKNKDNTASYKVSEFRVNGKSMAFYDEKGDLIIVITFTTDTKQLYLSSLVLFRDDTNIVYLKIDGLNPELEL